VQIAAAEPHARRAPQSVSAAVLDRHDRGCRAAVAPQRATASSAAAARGPRPRTAPRPRRRASQADEAWNGGRVPRTAVRTFAGRDYRGLDGAVVEAGATTGAPEPAGGGEGAGGRTGAINRS
jgi:hypothetical protein